MNPSHKGISRLAVPNDLAYLPVVEAHVRAVAALSGFSPDEQARLQLAAKEVAADVILYAFRPQEDAWFESACRQIPTGLEITVHDKGLPFDPDRLPQYQPGADLKYQDGRALDLLIIKELVDVCEFHRLGSEGNETRLVKYRATPAAVDGTTSQGLVDLPAPEKVPEDERVEIEIRWMWPEEAIEVTRCIYEAYGYTYVYEDLYYPERIVALNQSGALRSAVAVTESGELVGHAALAFSREDPQIAELAVIVTKPRYRGHAVARRLGEFLERQGRALGLKGLSVDQVTVHQYTQKFCHKLGFKDCAFLLAHAPATISFKEIAEQLSQRETVLLGFHYFDPPTAPLQIYPPPQHADMIRKLYEHLEIPVGIAEPGDQEFPQERSAVSVSIDAKMSAASLRVPEYGADIAQRLRHECYRLRQAQIQVWELFLNLESPLTPLVAAEAEKLNFIFTGILPGTSGGDSMVLQLLNGITVDYDAIKVDAAIAQEMLAYIRARDLFGE
jgi:anti-sigma regulatory factor (Ser/Thr protein kinase)/GNAT superfamily N-acetyltransferase